jgi:cysteine desulfurase family protein (TIGR01976 family)
MSVTTSAAALDAEACRRQFPALERTSGGRPCVFLDGPAGSQVPTRVIDAVSDYYRTMNANHGGVFETSRTSDAMLDETRRALRDFVGAAHEDEIAFGANMTTLTMAVSRAIGRTWSAGDEVLVTRLDHEANVTPWILAARDAGATVQHVDIHPDECTLDLDDLRSKLTDRTKLVAVGCASNAVGSVNPVREIAAWAHEVGALVFLDAVHYAPHRLIDVRHWGCDLLASSAYKFFGPHVGILWGRRELLDELPAYKLRVVPEHAPDRWMTGTQNHECIAGTLAAVEYLADIGRTHGADGGDRRAALETAFELIARYEDSLAERLLAGLAELPAYRVWGIADPSRLAERVPTISITHKRLPAIEVTRQLAAQGIFAWHGNFYALPLTERLGLEPEGMVRLGLLHYNTAAEVDRLLEVLAAMG